MYVRLSVCRLCVCLLNRSMWVAFHQLCMQQVWIYGRSVYRTGVNMLRVAMHVDACKLLTQACSQSKKSCHGKLCHASYLYSTKGNMQKTQPIPSVSQGVCIAELCNCIATAINSLVLLAYFHKLFVNSIATGELLPNPLSRPDAWHAKWTS